MVLAAAVPERPLLKPWYRFSAEDGRVVLDYAQSAVVFDGAAAASLLPQLLPLLDGEHRVDEIVASLGESVAPAIEHALDLLARHRLLAEGGEIPPIASEREETLGFLAANGAAPGDARERIATARVSIAGSARVADELARVLRCSGVFEIARSSLSAGPSRSVDLAVAAPAVGELAALGGWNEGCLAAGATWLAVLPYDGRLAALGPLFVPGETCCFECFRIRRASTSGYAPEFWSLEAEEPRYPEALALRRAVAGLAAWIAIRWLAVRDAGLPGVFHALELGALSLTRHHVWRVPRCPACSPAVGASPPSPWFDGELA